jgi:hypothetical protein
LWIFLFLFFCVLSCSAHQWRRACCLHLLRPGPPFQVCGSHRYVRQLDFRFDPLPIVLVWLYFFLHYVCSFS